MGYAEGLRTANDALGTSYTVAEMRREGSRRASGPAPGPARRAGARTGARAAPGPARGPTPESTPELTLMLGEGNGARSRAWATESARSRALESSPPRRRSDETLACATGGAMTEARASPCSHRRRSYGARLRLRFSLVSPRSFYTRRVALPRRETRVQDGGGDGGHRLRRRRRPRRVCSREPRPSRRRADQPSSLTRPNVPFPKASLSAALTRTIESVCRRWSTSCPSHDGAQASGAAHAVQRS